MVLLASQAQKRSYDDALKLKAVKDAEKTTKRAVVRKFKVDYDIHTYSNNMKVFVATQPKTIVAMASDQGSMVSCSCIA